MSLAHCECIATPSNCFNFFGVFILSSKFNTSSTFATLCLNLAMSPRVSNQSIHDESCTRYLVTISFHLFRIVCLTFRRLFMDNVTKIYCCCFGRCKDWQPVLHHHNYVDKLNAVSVFGLQFKQSLLKLDSLYLLNNTLKCKMPKIKNLLNACEVKYDWKLNSIITNPMAKPLPMKAQDLLRHKLQSSTSS